MQKHSQVNFDKTFFNDLASIILPFGNLTATAVRKIMVAK